MTGSLAGSLTGPLMGSPVLADVLADARLDGKELMIIILATILTLATPTGQLAPDSVLVYLGAMRIFLGVGIGGDYPMASTVSAQRSATR